MTLLSRYPLRSFRRFVVFSGEMSTSAKNSDSKVQRAPKFQIITPEPTKSFRDKKLYQVLKLDNGLTACLISDMEHCDKDESSDDEDDFEETTSEEDESEEDCSEQEEDGHESSDDVEMKKVPEVKRKMAAAALCVGVGSFSDPKEIPGLAHFLEHMVFMGSKKFPEENDFDKYISKRGGSDNASTDCETTTFYFECLEKYLLKSLDKFAQFFISPLMKYESMTREREAIESEFQMALPNDAYRKEQLLANLFNPSVPVNQFGWGNLRTLKDNVGDEVLYKALHEFRKRHYSAHRMTLCIQARLPLETLQKYVADCFSDVPTNNLPPLNFKQYSDIIYDTPNFNKIYYIIPTKNVIQVDLIWTLPSLLHLYKTKPHQYVSWLLGDEGKGSLMSYLRKKVWALAIYTGNGETGSEHNSMYAYFTVTIVLTQSGLENLFDVIELVYSYLNLLKLSGPQERIFKEIQSIENTSFRFADEKNAADNVEEIAESMHFYPSQDYLTGSELYFDYCPEDIQMVLNYLRPDKMNIMVLNKNMPEDIVCDQEETWFKTKYTIKEIPNKHLTAWANAEPLPEFSLPEMNQFLTTDFTLLKTQEPVTEYPVKILDNDKIELYYKLDRKFQTPTAYYYYYLVSPLPLENPTNACMMDMFISILLIQLTEEAYPAQVADLYYSLSAGEKGMILKVNGFNQNLPLLVGLIAKYVKNVAQNLTPDMFEAVKDNQTMMYYNKFLKPSSLNKDLRLSLLLNSYWSPIMKHGVVNKITFEMMKSFCDDWIKHLFIHGLIQGNVDRETAVKTTEDLIECLGCEPLCTNTYPKIRVVQLPKGEHCCRVQSFSVNDTNSHITNYYQVGPYSLKLSVIIELLMLIIEEPLFDVLRTKEQLGYNVFCTSRDTFGVLGYSITVNTQASRHTTHHVDGRIECFVKRMQKLLKKLSDKKINQYKRDLIKVKQCTDVLLKEEVTRNWAEIANADYLFDRLKQEIAAIEEIKLGDLKKFWDEHNIYNSKSTFKKLSIQVIGHNKDVQNGGDNSGESSHEREKRSTEKRDYKINLIHEPAQNEKHPKDYFIRSMDDFKSNLFLYPAK